MQNSEETSEEFDFESEPEPAFEDADGGRELTIRVAPDQKGFLVNKAQMAVVAGRTGPTIDKMIREGAPVEERGRAKNPWVIHTGKFFAWIERRSIANATGEADPDASALTSAKSRERAAVAQIREHELARLSGTTVTIDQVCALYAEELGVVRSLLLSMAGRTSQTIANALFAPDEAGKVEELIKADIEETMAAITGHIPETWNVKP